MSLPEQQELEKNVYIRMTNSKWILVGLVLAFTYIISAYAGFRTAEITLANSDCPENTIGVWMLYDDGARYRMCVEKRPEIKKR